MAAPPSVPPPRRPGLVKATPERFARDVRTATVVRRWARELRIPATELAEALGVSERVVRDLLDATKPFHLSDLAALPRAYRRRLVDELERDLDATGSDRR